MTEKYFAIDPGGKEIRKISSWTFRTSQKKVQVIFSKLLLFFLQVKVSGKETNRNI